MEKVCKKIWIIYWKIGQWKRKWQWKWKQWSPEADSPEVVDFPEVEDAGGGGGAF